MQVKYTTCLGSRLKSTRYCRNIASLAIKKKCVGIGDTSLFLSKLSEREFMEEIRTTRAKFAQKFPELENVIYEYKKQCVLLNLEFWYEKPLPQKCEKFFEIDINSLMDNVEEDSSEGQVISELCFRLLCEYLPHKYRSFEI